MNSDDTPSWLDVPAVTDALEKVAVNTLKAPAVRSEIRSAVRPAVIEAAAIMGVTLIAVLFLARRF